jgi:hypothetical protein
MINFSTLAFTVFAAASLVSSSPTPSNPRSDLVARKTGTQCFGQTMDAGDVAKAQQQMIDFCNNGGLWSDNSQMRFTSGDVTVFGCNYGGQQECHEEDLRVFFAEIDRSCNESGAGFWSQENWKVTYGRTLHGNSVC